uniref:Uncharacterized protein n=1 Tax=Ditylenchus dipsaci TaxID=166011 RepID=A0A915D4H1_9BILA
MNLPPRDSNIEIVDMEVSSGPSSIASTCSSSLSNNGVNDAECSGADAPNPEEFHKSKDVFDGENESIALDSIPCPPPPPISIGIYIQPDSPIKAEPAINHSNEPIQPAVKRPLTDPQINDEDADQAGSSETKRPRF